MLQTNAVVPVGGSFTVAVPTSFDSAAFSCRVIEPQNLILTKCGLQTNSVKEAVITLGSAVEAFASVYIELGGARNPASTAHNKDYRVQSLGKDGTQIEVAAGLSLLNFLPARLTEFSVRTESAQLGARTLLLIDLKVGFEVPCKTDRSGCMVAIRSPSRNPYDPLVRLDSNAVFSANQTVCQVLDAVSHLLRI